MSQREASELPEARRRWLAIAAPLGVLLLLLTITGLLVRRSQELDEAAQREEFDFRVRDVERRISQRMGAYEQVLRGTSALFAASRRVERAEFRNYVAALRLHEEYPGVQGVGFSALVPADELEAHVAATRGEGFPDYVVRPPGARDPYSAIVFLEPFTDRNLRAFGYDMYAEPIRREAMERARDEGRPVLSGRVVLVQELDTGVQAGVLLYLPVYRHDPAEPLTTAERRELLAGWAYAPFRMNDLMAGLLGERGAELDLHLYDGAEPDDANLLYDSTQGERGPHDGAAVRSSQLAMTIAGRRWTLLVRSREGYGARLATPTTALVGIGGGALSVLLAALVGTFASGQGRALRLAQERNRALIAAQIELGESERRFRTMADGAPVLIWIAGTDKLCNWFNRPWLEFTGRTMGQELGNGWADGVHPEDLGGCLRVYNEHFDRRHPFTMEYRLRRHDGAYRWITDSGKPRFDEAGVFAGYVGSCLDVTQRREAEAATDRAHRFAQATLDALPEHLCVLDERGVIVSTNRAWRAFAAANGAAPGVDYLGTDYLEICAKATGDGAADARRFGEALQELLAGARASYEQECECPGPAQRRTFLATATRFVDGDRTRVLVAHAEISARVAAEARVRLSEARLAAALDGSQDGFVDMDLASGVTTRSPRCWELAGRSPAELPSETDAWLALVHPDDLAGLVAAQERLRAGQAEAIDHEYRVRTARGEWHWLRTRAKGFDRGSDGRPTRIAGTLSDADERHRSEERALEQARLRGLASRMNEAELVLDLDGRIVEANERALALYGRVREELLGLDLRALRAPGSLPAVEQTLGEAIERGVRFETENLHKDGTRFPVEVSSRSFEIGGRRFVHSLVRDLTEQRRQEARLRLLAGLTTATQDAVLLLDVAHRIAGYANAAERLFGVTEQEALGRTPAEAFGAEYPDGDRAEHLARLDRGESSRIHAQVTHGDGHRIEVDVSATPRFDERGAKVGYFTVVRDVTADRRREHELQAALARVKALSGLLPICMHCHKIRDDQGYWAKLEAYLSEHTDAQLSHGICPSCMRERYGDDEPT